MLNCSTCHKKKPIEHFYAYPDHRAHIPMRASPEDGEALAQLLADGLVSETTAYQTPTHARATLASARAQLANVGRPVESEAQRARREAAQARAVEREEEARQAEEDAAQVEKWMLRTLGVGVLAFVGWLGWLGWQAWDVGRGGASA